MKNTLNNAIFSLRLNLERNNHVETIDMEKEYYGNDAILVAMIMLIQDKLNEEDNK